MSYTELYLLLAITIVFNAYFEKTNGIVGVMALESPEAPNGPITRKLMNNNEVEEAKTRTIQEITGNSLDASVTSTSRKLKQSLGVPLPFKIKVRKCHLRIPNINSGRACASACTSRGGYSAASFCVISSSKTCCCSKNIKSLWVLREDCSFHYLTRRG